MARKRKHEDHTNHEAWAIPYGDLITLLLAFFVVMYAISSVNAGKFRVLSDSLNAAFRGAPTTLDPVQLGDKEHGASSADPTTRPDQALLHGQQRTMLETVHAKDPAQSAPNSQSDAPPPEHPIAKQLAHVADELENAMQPLIDADLVTVRRHEFWLEVEVRTDILFASGQAVLSDKAVPALDALASTLAKYPNPVRVEGHTDNQPINTKYFPSNWELSAARAASVVHRFATGGISPARLSVIGFGEFRPAQSNATAAGRVANRRVVIVILAGEGAPAPDDAAGAATEASAANVPAALPPLAAQGEAAQPQVIESAPNVFPPTTRSTPIGTETAPTSARINAGAGIPAQE